MNVYLDNAATTPIDKKVLAEMLPYMEEFFGNPSSIHSHGRRVRAGIEKARRDIAKYLNTSAAEIFFTSGGTEADNTAIRGAIYTYELKHVITVHFEHHAVLHTLEALAKKGTVKLSFVNNDEKGNIDYQHLETLLKNNDRSLISIMHANNEVATVSDMERIGELAKTYNAIYHSDTVQTIGHFPIDLQKINIDYIVGSAHKLHGPKGVGFLYVRKGSSINPFMTGGVQERNMRGGTENVYGIVALAKALEIATLDMEEHQKYVKGLKKRMIARLQDKIEGVRFNGMSGDVDKSLYTVLNVSLPPALGNEMLLFNLDINGVSASGGSACTSGSQIGSHVLQALKTDPKRGYVRFSFSRFNTEKEIDFAADKLAEVYRQEMINQL